MHLSLLLASFLAAPEMGLEPPSVAEILEQARAALKEAKTGRAHELANEAVKRDGKRADAYFVRGMVFETERKHGEALADFEKAIALDPKAAEAYNHRGSEHLKRADFDLAIKDFDKFLELQPDEEAGHWRRGIAYYYAGKYELGRKQFEAYEKVDKNDAENVIWQYLCIARAGGREKARLAIGEKHPRDRRIPLSLLYEVFCGRTTIEGVFRIAHQQNPSPEELRERLFYAHFYTGLYHYAAGNKKDAIEHLNKAVDDYKIGHYMYDIALVHRDRIRKELEH